MTARTRLFFVSFLSFLMQALSAGLVQAEITPEQVAVIANSRVPESVAVAEHYVRARKVPPFQLFALDLPTEETISRKDYEQKLLGPLRDALAHQKFPGRIRVLLTVYGVPLRVSAPEPGDEDKEELLDATEYRNRSLLTLQEIVNTVRPIGSTEEVAPFQAPQSFTSRELISTVAEELQAAASRLNDLEGEPRRKGTATLAQAVLRFGGFTALSQNLKPSEAEKADESREKLRLLQAQMENAKQLLSGLERAPTAENRKRAYALAEKLLGAAGVLSRAERSLEQKHYKDADASVDSELALLWWDRQQYEPSGRMPNPFYYKAPKTDTSQPLLPIMMVSRLDGPSASIAKRLVDDALQAEEQGLSGDAYLDARGIKFKYDNEFSVWDQNLRDTAWMLRRLTDYSVTLDDYPALLTEAEDTALYAGWYSLRNYQDVFEFEPGAIGYHIASEEAVSLRQPEEKGWCKGMLEKGVGVTLGAVAEPYLDSFPMPRQFFGLMLTGKYSLVEAYALSTPYISWRMVLIGDPLYNPWSGKFEVPLKELALVSAGEVPFHDFPEPPGKRPASDPVRLRADIERQLNEQAAAIDSFFESMEKRNESSPKPPAPRLP